jgi:hypothetical protein
VKRQEKLISLTSTIVLIILFTAFVGVLEARAQTINFEGIADSTSITNQYAGLTFMRTTAATAKISHNDIEFPPRSGTNVVYDTGGPITITFTTAVSSFRGYFTYTQPVTLQAFNSLNLLVASSGSIHSNNTALSGIAGSSPNELLMVAFASGISRITITGAPLGESFALDDISVGLAPTAANVSVSGRVMNAKFGVPRAQIILTGSSGVRKSLLTNSFGFFRFDDVQVGETYIVEVVSKRYSFAPRAITVLDEISDMDFYAK